MSAIAQTLDEKLQQWNPETARRVEKLIHEIIELVERENGQPAAEPVLPRRARRDDPLFADSAVWTGPAPRDLSANHDQYLYGDKP